MIPRPTPGLLNHLRDSVSANDTVTGTPAETIAAFNAGDLDRALEGVTDYDLMILLNIEEAGTKGQQIRIEPVSCNFSKTKKKRYRILPIHSPPQPGQKIANASQ